MEYYSATKKEPTTDTQHSMAESQMHYARCKEPNPRAAYSTYVTLLKGKAMGSEIDQYLPGAEGRRRD